jgi:hypothetical protein
MRPFLNHTLHPLTQCEAGTEGKSSILALRLRFPQANGMAGTPFKKFANLEAGDILIWINN